MGEAGSHKQQGSSQEDVREVAIRAPHIRGIQSFCQARRVHLPGANRWPPPHSQRGHLWAQMPTMPFCLRIRAPL